MSLSRLSSSSIDNNVAIHFLFDVSVGASFKLLPRIGQNEALKRKQNKTPKLKS